MTYPCFAINVKSDNMRKSFDHTLTDSKGGSDEYRLHSCSNLNLTYLAQKLQFRDGKVKNSLSSCALSTELSIQSFVNTLSNSVLSIDDLTIDRSG